ncbi:hypothetical protein [Calderihabitans maritimus]|uniref:Uncharacterized protein n=1 Tax=Calderihabitans maritimus TaxID=1246530 RepID=A0A1Z5HRD7_9FIRM|nr:hypothetical protein [Calderihabitans maritimus]GAW92074.1 hypothetical protein Moth_2261 [Calderihabitans maritimus]
MSMNELIKQGISLWEDILAMPFRLTKELWKDNNESPSTTSQAVTQTLDTLENLIRVPFRMTREFFEGGNHEEKDHQTS